MRPNLAGQNSHTLQNRQAIILLFAANSISGLAQGITMLAIPWYFINTLDKQGLYGLLYAVITGLATFWMLYSGALIDRFDRKRIFMGINASGAAMLLSLAAFGYLYGSVDIWVAGLAFGTTFFIYNIHFPTLYAFAQEITAAKDYNRIISLLEVQHQLTATTSGLIGAALLAGMAWSGTLIAGLAIGPIHISPWPLERILLANGITYLIALALVYFIRYQSVAEKHIDTGSVWMRMRMGLDYLRANPYFALFGMLSYSVFISVLVAIYYLVPKYTEVHLDAGIENFGVFRGAFSLGAVLAGVLVVYLFRNTRPSVAVLIMGFIAAAFYFVGIFNTSMWLFYLLGLVLGICNAGTRIMRAAYIFKRVPNSIIGRVSGIFNLYHMTFRFAFTLLFAMPFFSEGSNVLWAFLGLGLFVTTSMLLLLWHLPRIIRA